MALSNYPQDKQLFGQVSSQNSFLGKSWRCLSFGYALPSTKPITQMALTHLDEDGRPSMVDVGKKEITSRTAHAQAIVDLPEIVSCQLSDDEIHSPKGPVFSTAILAGIQAAKKTPDLIPLCHTVPLNDATICVTPNENARELKVDCKVSACHQTGVEMEALTGATIAALTIYDMTKALSRDVVIRSVRLMEKTGGKQDFRREN